MNHVIYVGFLCVVVALVLLGYSTADNSKNKETRASQGSLLNNILSGRYKRQLREICDQSSIGCISQDFSGANNKRNKEKKKRKKKRKNRKKENNNKRKMKKQKTEPEATCPYLYSPADNEDDPADDNEQCPQVL